MSTITNDASFLYACDPNVYVSQSKGAMHVDQMATKHLVNAKKVLLDKWAAVCESVKLATKYISSKDGSPSNNMSINFEKVAENPAHLFPVYDTICNELTARSEGTALRHAREEMQKSLSQNLAT